MLRRRTEEVFILELSHYSNSFHTLDTDRCLDWPVWPGGLERLGTLWGSSGGGAKTVEAILLGLLDDAESSS